MRIMHLKIKLLNDNRAITFRKEKPQMDNAKLNMINDLRLKPLLTVKDLQLILGIGRTSTYKYLQSNPPFRVEHINGRICIPSKDVFYWLDGKNK